MTINVENRPKTIIEINLPEKTIKLNAYTDTPSAYKAVSNAYRESLLVESRVRKALESEDPTEKSVDIFGALEYQATALIEALKVALDGKEYAKIEKIVPYLPVKALRDIVSAISDAMCTQLVERIKENKI